MATFDPSAKPSPTSGSACFRRVRLLALASLAAVNVMPAVARATSRSAAETFLSEQFQFDAGDFKQLDERRAVMRALPASDGREVAMVGVVRMRVPPAFYISQLRAIETFKRDEAVLAIGVFRRPASPDDAAALTLEPEDIERLQRCRPGSCKVQLPADALRRFHDEVRWGTPEAAADANRLMRDLLAGMVNRYRQSGDDGLMTYSDGDEPLSVAAQFHALLESGSAVLGRFPALYRYMMDYPRAQPAEVDDVIYWSKEKMGPATVVGVTHLAIAPLGGPPPAAFAVASKQLYATHYFDASLGLTILLTDDAAADSASYLVYVNRSRLDILGGFWGGLKRPIVRSRARSAAATHLIQVRDRVEAARSHR